MVGRVANDVFKEPGIVYGVELAPGFAGARAHKPSATLPDTALWEAQGCFRAHLAKANLRILFQSLFAQVVHHNSAVKCVACGEYQFQRRSVQSLLSQTPKEIGKVVFHLRDFVPRISKHRPALVQ